MLAQLVISGLALGSIYALIALALVLIHKATDVVNFAQGEMATFTTFCVFVAMKSAGLSLIFALLLAAPLGFVIGALVQRVVIQPIAHHPPVNLLIAAIGLWIAFHHLSGWIWGYDPYKFPGLLAGEVVDLFGARIAANSIATLAVAVAVMLVLYLFFEHTKEGIAMRAASMNVRAAKLMGISVSRVWLLSWAVASAVGAVAGVLTAPLTFLDFEMMVTVLLKAFAAAILGGFNSLPGAVVGGFVIGLLEVFFGALVSTAFKDNFAFVIIIAVLMIKPTGLFGRHRVKKV